MIFPRLLGASMLIAGALALAADAINLTVTNDGIVDIFVSVTDMSSRPPTSIVSHQRINGFTSLPVTVSADATGKANVAWTAIGVDSSDPRCGHATLRGLNGDANVNVHVDSDCAP